MAVIRWRSFDAIDTDARYTVMASRLPLRSAWKIPRFLALTREVQAQLAVAEGLVGYSLNAQLLHKTFWTLSAWDAQQHLDDFAATAHHQHVMATLRPHLEPTMFQTWTVTGAELPVTWDTAFARLTGGS